MYDTVMDVKKERDALTEKLAQTNQQLAQLTTQKYQLEGALAVLNVQVAENEAPKTRAERRRRKT